MIFAIHCHESAMGVHGLPILNPALTSLPIPNLRVIHPSEPSLTALSYLLNLGWQSISHMVIHMFQCYFQIIPSLPSPTESKSLFPASVSLLLPRI